MKNDVVELIQRFLSGDEAAFAELVDKYKKQVHALAWRKTEDFHIAEDITQEVFLKVFQELHTLKDPNYFPGWLYVTTTNCCYTWHRKKRISVQPLQDEEITMSEKDFYSQHVVEERTRTAVESQREVVKKLLAKLDESERTVMTLHYLGEMTIEEISKFIGVSSGTIKSRLQRARNRLQKEEPMIREALEHFQLSPNLTDNILKEVARLKPTAPTTSNPLIPWVAAVSTLAVVLLMFGFGNHQYLSRYQKPYSLDANAETMVEIVDAPIVANLESTPGIRLQIRNTNVVALLNDPEAQQNDDNAASSEKTQTDKTVKDYIQWKLPVGAKARLGKGLIHDVQYNAEVGQLAVATDNGIWIYDALTYQPLRLLNKHVFLVRNIEYSPDGKLLASLDSDNVIHLWNSQTGTHKYQLDYRDSILNIVFTSDSKSLVTINNYGKVTYWDPTTGKKQQDVSRIEIGDGDVFGTAFSTDKFLFATGNQHKVVELWNILSGERKHALEEHEAIPLNMAFSPDGETLVSAGWGGKVRLWNTDAGKEFYSIDSDRNKVYSIAFSAEGSLFATGNYTGSINIYQKDTAELKHTLEGHSEIVLALSFSPDLRSIASGSYDGTLSIWDVVSGKKIHTESGYLGNFSCFAFSPDSKTIVSPTREIQICLWDTTNGTLQKTLNKADYNLLMFVNDVAFNPSGETIATASIEKSINLWDRHTGEQIKKLIGHESVVLCVAYSPDGKTIASGSSDKTVRLWDAKTGQLKYTLEGHTKDVTNVVFSPDSKTVVSGSDDRTVHLWRADSGAVKRVIKEHFSKIANLAYSPDGQTLAIADHSDTIYLWDINTTTLNPLNTPLEQQKELIMCLAYSPDSLRLAVGYPTGTVALLDTTTGALQRSFSGHRVLVEQVAFAPDGKTLASLCALGQLLLWEIE